MSENEEIISNLIKFVEYVKNNEYINNIYIYELNSLKMIYTDKINTSLHHSNELIDFILHNIEFIVVDNDFKNIYIFDKEQKFR